MKETQSVGIVVLKDEDVLLIKAGPASSHFETESGLPAGRVEPGETNEETAVRELQEETGLKSTIEDMKFIKTFVATFETKHGPVTYIWHTFLCTKYSGSLAPSDETTPYWVKINKLGSIPNLLPNTQETVALARQ